MPRKRFEGPCELCQGIEPTGYYRNHLCHNCYRKQRRLDRGLKKSGPESYDGPCVVCGSYESSSGRFVQKMCRACYKRVNNSGNPRPRTKYTGPCLDCGKIDKSIRYNRKLCPTCYRKFRNVICGDEQRRRASKRNVENTLTEEQWKQVLEFYNYTCAYCGKSIPDCYTLDHVIPISKGGPHAIDNVVPACLSCNSGKGNRKPPKPVTVLFPDGKTMLVR